MIDTLVEDVVDTLKRLQSSEWHKLKDKLTLLAYSKSKNGNYCGFYRDSENNGYYHWMNDDEKRDFLPLTRLYPQWVSNEVQNARELRGIIEEIKEFRN